MVAETTKKKKPGATETPPRKFCETCKTWRSIGQFATAGGGPLRSCRVCTGKGKKSPVTETRHVAFIEVRPGKFMLCDVKIENVIVAEIGEETMKVAALYYEKKGDVVLRARTKGKRD